MLTSERLFGHSLARLAIVFSPRRVSALSLVESDHYAILGLDRRCTIAQIRAAYRSLTKRNHPDLNPGSPEAVARMQALNFAYETLSDPVRRKAYNRDLDAARKPASAAGASKVVRNISQDVLLRIEDFFRGISLEVRVNDPGNPSGPETYQLKIPPQTAPGARFRLPRAAPFQGGFVQVRVRARPGFRFKVRGSDLRCDLRISNRRASQGGTEIIAGPAGTPVRLKIPPNVSRGVVVRIAGQGLPESRGGRGDLLVRITYRPEVRVSRSLGR